MSVSENFDRKFNKSMRGYNTDEVDAAVDALLRYCDELEEANREFEIANNDLIDEKTELNLKITELSKQIEALETKNSELTENLNSIKSVYNGYREKFGEAKDLVTKAKASSAEILAKAKAKAEFIAEEAEEKHKETIAEYSREILERKTLVEQLDICYNEFSKKLQDELSSMLNRVSDFNVAPILPAGIPEDIALSAESEEIPSEDSDSIFDIPSDIEFSEIEAEQNEETSETVVLDEPPSPSPKARVAEPESISALGPIWREQTIQSTSSEVSQIKNSLEEINLRVAKKKSTPHI